MTGKRLKKKDTPSEVWIAHRKLRKKIASAKWYAKKRHTELQEQAEFRKKCEAQFQEKKKQRIWSEEQFFEWRCVTSHMVHGWPARPCNSNDTIVTAQDWCRLMDLCSTLMGRMNSILLNEAGATTPVLWYPAKLHLARRLIMTELLFWWKQRTERLGIPQDDSHAMDHFITLLTSGNRILDPTDDDDHASSSSSSWFRRAVVLTQGALPVSSSVWGLLFLQLWQLGKVASQWSTIITHAMNVHKTKNVISDTSSTTACSITRNTQHIHTANVTGTPTFIEDDTSQYITSPCISHCPVLQHIVQELFAWECAMMDQRKEEEIREQNKNKPCEERNDTNDTWSNFSLTSIPSSLDSCSSVSHWSDNHDTLEQSRDQ